MIVFLTALFQSLAEFLKGVNMWMPDLVKLVHTWIAVGEAKKQRYIDAAKASVDSELKAQTEQAKKEQANLLAFKTVIDETWKTRYADILSFIKAGREDKVLLLLEVIDNEPVDQILFHDDKTSPEFKALKIVQIMRKVES
jgi:hypothetical protein